MQEFVLIFRQSPASENASPEEMAARIPQWESWFAGIAAQGKYIPGKRLGTQGKVLKAGGVITDGPFVEIKEQLAGFISVRAENLEEATTLAHGCPIISQGGNVEIRNVIEIAFK